MKEIYSINYHKIYSEGRLNLAVHYVVGMFYTVGEDSRAVTEIRDMGKNGFQVLFEGDWMIEVPRTNDVEVVYRPKETEDANGESNDK
jgi:hypothetical protein